MSKTLLAIKEIFKGSDAAMISAFGSGLMTEEEFLNSVKKEV